MDAFATPLAFLLLPLPFLAARLLPPAPARHGAAMRLPETVAARLAAAGAAGDPGRGHAVLAWILWLALVAAFAGPRIAAPSPALPVSGRDLVLALDLSGSMDRKDFTLDGAPVKRLDAVKRIGAAFVRGRAGDRVGLVIFAERAFFAAAPTFDVESVARTIEEATIGIAGRSTAIGEGLGLALKRLERSTAPARVVILLSDGANNAGTVGPRDVATLARELGVRVHTVALGANDLETATDDTDAVDSETLRRVAEASGGTAFRVRGTADLEAVGRAIDALEASPNAARPVQVYHSLWIWPAVVALLAALAIALGGRLPAVRPRADRAAAAGPGGGEARA